MEDAGFECKHVRNGKFKHRRRDSSSAEAKFDIYENIEFLRCSRETRDGWITYFEDVAIVIENEFVVNFLANWDAVGP
jgi:hypothetical protein